MPPSKKPPNGGGKSGPPKFVASYVHWRSKKLMVARDYGYKGWPFGKA